MTSSPRDSSSSSLHRATTGTSTHEPTESETLHSQCTKLIKRLFPDSGKAGDCSSSDVNTLIAIFHRNRFAHCNRSPRLPRSTNLYALNKLVNGSPFHDYHPQTGLIDMRRYLTLLAEALRSFKVDGTSVEHVHRNEWYAGICRLDGICAKARRHCFSSLQIELWDVAFLLKHCHYLLTSIEDSYNIVEKGVERFKVLTHGALNGYGNQLVHAKENLFTRISHHRSTEKWHEIYMGLEEMCFDAYAMGVDELHDGVLEVVKRIEADTIVLLRTKLEDELAREGHSTHGHAVRHMFRNIAGEVTRQITSTGPYEENTEYFKYGILDLMYQSSFWVHNRVGCFTEIIGAIQLVLERSHRSANLLHRKAIDLYNRIDELGKEDFTVYGQLEDRRSIEEWISKNINVEALEDSKRRWKRVIEETKKVKAQEEEIKSFQLQEQAPKTPTQVVSTASSETRRDFAIHPVPQNTINSSIFPIPPSHESDSTSRSNSLVSPTTPSPAILNDPLRHSPEALDHHRPPLEYFNITDQLNSFKLNQPSPSVSATSSPHTSPSAVHCSPAPQGRSTKTDPAVSTTPSSARGRPHPLPLLSVTAPPTTPLLQLEPTGSSILGEQEVASPTNTAVQETLIDFGEGVSLTPQRRTNSSVETSQLVYLDGLHTPPRSPSASSLSSASVTEAREKNNIDLTDAPQSPRQSHHHRPSMDRFPLSPSRTSFARASTTASTFTNDCFDTLSLRSRNNSTLPQTEGFFQLLKSPVMKKDINAKVSLTAISATGQKAAVLTEKCFFVFNTTPIVSFVCGGEFFKQTDFKYESLNRQLNFQHPTPDKFKVKEFSSVALSDSFLAIGVPGKVMVFYLNGDHAGRWVFCDSMDSGKGIERLSFSRCGKELLALLRYEKDAGIDIKAKIYNTEDFPTSKLERRKPAPPNDSVEVQWSCDNMHIPSAAAFSTDGNMIAICTTRSGPHAQIQLLKRFDSGWKRWKVETIKVFPTDDRRDWNGDGLTGISFFADDKCLALSLDSSSEKLSHTVPDCYRIKTSKDGTKAKLKPLEKDLIAPGSIANYAIAVSQPYFALALLNRAGQLQIRRHGPEHKLEIQQRKSPRKDLRGPASPHPISLAFDDTGEILFLIDHHGDLEIHDFGGTLGDIRIQGYHVLDED